MATDPWYKVATPRKEVREGRSFNPDEFAIALEQVVAKTVPEDYRDPAQFFSRTCFTRALREHTGMVLRRLSGRTDNTAPVLTLITQFGGGKTHSLTALYHIARSGAEAREFLRGRFEACYPFHSATLSVFQRKWQALAQYQQTRGMLAMLAQWIALASQESFSKARREPLLTIGSAPLFDAGFRSVVLGQLGESRLVAAIDADVAGAQAHARAGRRHQGAAARHPPSRRHGDPVRVVRRAKWTGGGPLREQIAERTKQRRQSPRLYPGSLVWCLKKPGRELREKVELWLAWRRIAGEVAEGTLGGDFDPADRTEIRVKVTDAEQAARDEVWGGYRFVVLADVERATPGTRRRSCRPPWPDRPSSEPTRSAGVR